MKMGDAAVIRNFGFLLLNIMLVPSGGQEVTSSSDPTGADDKSSWSDTIKTAGIIGAVLTSLAVLGILVVLVFIARHQRSGDDLPSAVPAKPPAVSSFRSILEKQDPQFPTRQALTATVPEMPTSFIPQGAPRAIRPGTQPLGGPAPADSRFEPVSFSESATLLLRTKKDAEDASGGRQTLDPASHPDGGVYSVALSAAPYSTQQYFVNHSYQGQAPPLPAAGYASPQKADPESEEYLYAQLVKSNKDEYIVLPDDIFTERL